MNLKPFFTYYGGKYRSAPKYPYPHFDRIVEPFAGSAGYALRHYDKDVHLIDLDPIIVGVWSYLIAASSDEIMGLPSEFGEGRSVDDLSAPQEAKWLIGFWLNKGAASPCKTPSSWMRSGIRPNSYWGQAIKERIASQVDSIRHWKASVGSYQSAPDEEATWFIDPPYQQAGKLYRKGSNGLDFNQLGDWCSQRKGQVIVCENMGAKWLPFVHFGDTKSTPGARGKSVSKEAIWTNS